MLANIGFLAWRVGRRTSKPSATRPSRTSRSPWWSASSTSSTCFFRLATWAPTSWPLKARWTLGEGVPLRRAARGRGTGRNGVVPGGGGRWRLSTARNAPLITVSWVLVAPARRDRRHRPATLPLPLPRPLREDPPLRRLERPRAVLDADAAAARRAPVALGVLAVVTFSVALPWLRLRRVDVRIERPSSHVALVRFDHGVTPFAGSSTAVSRSPLREWHSFANVPSPGEPGFRLTISRAGDWTGLVHRRRAARRSGSRASRRPGSPTSRPCSRKVVYVATGSGIGPCLPHLLAAEVPARLRVGDPRSPQDLRRRAGRRDPRRRSRTR